MKEANYAEAFESWAATQARFPLRWASRDKEEYQVSGGAFVLPALDLEDNGDLRGIPLDLALHRRLVRPLCPGLKFRERPCRMSTSGALLWFGFCEWMCGPGHRGWPVCHPGWWRPLTEPGLFVDRRSSQNTAGHCTRLQLLDLQCGNTASRFLLGSLLGLESDFVLDPVPPQSARSQSSQIYHLEPDLLRTSPAGWMDEWGPSETSAMSDFRVNSTR